MKKKEYYINEFNRKRENNKRFISSLLACEIVVLSAFNAFYNNKKVNTVDSVKSNSYSISDIKIDNDEVNNLIVQDKVKDSEINYEEIFNTIMEHRGVMYYNDGKVYFGKINNSNDSYFDMAVNSDDKLYYFYNSNGTDCEFNYCDLDGNETSIDYSGYLIGSIIQKNDMINYYNDNKKFDDADFIKYLQDNNLIGKNMYDSVDFIYNNKVIFNDYVNDYNVAIGYDNSGNIKFSLLKNNDIVLTDSDELNNYTIIPLKYFMLDYITSDNVNLDKILNVSYLTSVYPYFEYQLSNINSEYEEVKGNYESEKVLVLK